MEEVFSKIFLSLRKELGYNQETMSKKLGVSKSTIAMWETGKRLPSPELYEQIADFFNLDIDYLYGRTDIRRKIHFDNYGDEYVNKKVLNNSIPVFGRIAADVPIESITDVDESIEISKDMVHRGNYFAFKILGDSMEPVMFNDDIVIFHFQDDAESSSIIIAIVGDNEGICRRIVKYADGIALVPLNPKYEPMLFSNKEVLEKPVRIIGRVVELRRKV